MKIEKYHEKCLARMTHIQIVIRTFFDRIYYLCIEEIRILISQIQCVEQTKNCVNHQTSSSIKESEDVRV